MDQEVTIVSRSDWGAVPPKKKKVMKDPAKRVIIHHTAVPTGKDLEECRKLVCSIQRGHMTDRGFDDIGYNFLVGSDGIVFEGRGWRVVGAHAKGNNSDSVGVAFMGNFEKDTPSTEALSSVRKLLALGVSEGVLQTKFDVLGHKDVGSTECPGKNLIAALPQLKP